MIACASRVGSEKQGRDFPKLAPAGTTLWNAIRHPIGDHSDDHANDATFPAQK
jgi:hypothetical protein